MRRPALAAAVMLFAAAAHAGGRPAFTDGIAFRPGDPQSRYVATTFGLLISHDGGCTFRWVCEANIGYGGIFDPKYAVAADGTIFATTYTSLRVSRDDGCSFTQAGPLIWIEALDLGPSGEVWIGTAESGKPNDVLSSRDNGHTFASRGLQSPTIWWKSVKVAPSNAKRIYVGGYQVAGTEPDGGAMAPRAHLRRSDDDGAHWTASPLAGVRYAATPIVHVMAVDPRNADVIFMRSLAANPPNGDVLYRSRDGGMTLTEVLATTDLIRDVVIDGDRVVVATRLGGSFRSTDGGATFSPLEHPPQLGCLAKAPDGSLLGCTANWSPDFMALARSSDGGATWQKAWQFSELARPAVCPTGTAEHDACEKQWPTLRDQFGATGPTCQGSAGPPVTASETPAAKKRGGCCDAGDDAPGPIALAIAGIAACFRRRRASSGSAAR